MKNFINNFHKSEILMFLLNFIKIIKIHVNINIYEFEKIVWNFVYNNNLIRKLWLYRYICTVNLGIKLWFIILFIF